MTPQERSDKLAKIYETIEPSKYLICTERWDDVITIGDCLDWMKNTFEIDFDCSVCDMDRKLRYIIRYWKSKRLPIDAQSDECVEYIYSLIK